ncbi:hypothetical protein RFI_02613 [Reticulomyxa filosa]|uniref:Uncharacterized protein n=1 Tax=Reticulomyxa filosa TaxID=46433 RepID=X6PA06_RETFI|nr:hypothetical protein RFI_02613 [Reticulomyxa filosa]|eukprot:ETO34482.1 hypothetical protein RFI_02613 [Reticulomyxa filosa]
MLKRLIRELLINDILNSNKNTESQHKDKATEAPDQIYPRQTIKIIPDNTGFKCPYYSMEQSTIQRHFVSFHQTNIFNLKKMLFFKFCQTMTIIFAFHHSKFDICKWHYIFFFYCNYQFDHYFFETNNKKLVNKYIENKDQNDDKVKL